MIRKTKVIEKNAVTGMYNLKMSNGKTVSENMMFLVQEKGVHINAAIKHLLLECALQGIINKQTLLLEWLTLDTFWSNKEAPIDYEATAKLTPETEERIFVTK